MTKQTQFFIRKFEKINDRLDENYNDPMYDEINTLLDISKYENITIGDIRILKNITKGKTPKGLTYVDEGIPFLHAENIVDEKVHIDFAKRIDEKIHMSSELAKSQLKKGNVLATMAGNIGQCAVYDYDQECNCNQAIAILTIDHNAMSAQYLTKVLNSRIGQLQFGKLQKIVDQPNIGFDEIKSMQIPYPKTPKAQDQIIYSLSIFEKEICDLKIKLNKNIKKMEDVLFTELGIVLPSDDTISYYYDILDYDERLSFGMHHPNNKLLQKALKNAKYKPRPLNDFITLSDDSIDTNKTNPDHIFTYIGLEDIEQNTGKLIGVKELSGKEIMSKSKIFKLGQIMFSGLRPYLNKVFILNDYDSAIGSAELFVCNHKENVLVELLKYYLISEATLGQTKWILSGASYPRLDDEDFLNLQIIMPEDDTEQTRILKKVKEIDKKTEELRDIIDVKKKDFREKFEKSLFQK